MKVGTELDEVDAGGAVLVKVLLLDFSDVSMSDAALRPQSAQSCSSHLLTPSAAAEDEVPELGVVETVLVLVL